MLGKVVLLNGCSSAGKTTLALELQRLSKDHLQHIALDQFRDGLPPQLRGLNSPKTDPGSMGLNVIPLKSNNKRVTSIQFGEYGLEVLRAMRRTVAHLANAGCSVVVDDILFERDFLLDYADVLDPSNSWLVAVRCDLSVVRDREAARAGRFPGTADSHYKSIHSHGVRYDIEVDTTEKSANQVASEILKGLESEPMALRSLR